nr:orexin receptor type 2-like isoform X1 [Onthophagus taurus]XP_022914653.1 orexin receptor type 2-like isoform X1 [Onthophagus taurus]
MQDFDKKPSTNYNSAMDDVWKHLREYPDVMYLIYPKWWSWMVICLSIVVFVVGLIGNALVCVALYRNGSMRTVTNYFLMNLAIADFMVILFCLPATLTWDITLTWLFGTICCKIITYLQTVSVTVSVLTLSFISMERWYAICFPLKFKSTIGRAKTAILIIWIIALTLDVPELVVYETIHRGNESISILFTQCEPVWPQMFDLSWTIMKMTLLYAIPLCVMAIMYYRIGKVLRISEKQLTSRGILLRCKGITFIFYFVPEISENTHLHNFSITASMNKKGQLESRKKAAKMLASVVGMFALCFLPLHTIEILRLTMEMRNNEVNRAFSMFSHWLCYVNSAVNPLIYNFMSKKFRKEFKKSFECCTKAGRQKRKDTFVFQQMGSLSKNRISNRKFTHTSGSLSSRTDTVTTKLSE